MKLVIWLIVLGLISAGLCLWLGLYDDPAWLILAPFTGAPIGIGLAQLIVGRRDP